MLRLIEVRSLLCCLLFVTLVGCDSAKNRDAILAAKLAAETVKTELEDPQSTTWTRFRSIVREETTQVLTSVNTGDVSETTEPTEEDADDEEATNDEPADTDITPVEEMPPPENCDPDECQPAKNCPEDCPCVPGECRCCPEGEECCCPEDCVCRQPAVKNYAELFNPDVTTPLPPAELDDEPVETPAPVVEEDTLKMFQYGQTTYGLRPGQQWRLPNGRLVRYDQLSNSPGWPPVNMSSGFQSGRRSSNQSSSSGFIQWQDPSGTTCRNGSCRPR